MLSPVGYLRTLDRHYIVNISQTQRLYKNFIREVYEKEYTRIQEYAAKF